MCGLNWLDCCVTKYIMNKWNVVFFFFKLNWNNFHTTKLRVYVSLSFLQINKYEVQVEIVSLLVRLASVRLCLLRLQLTSYIKSTNRLKTSSTNRLISKFHLIFNPRANQANSSSDAMGEALCGKTRSLLIGWAAADLIEEKYFFSFFVCLTPLI